MPGRVLSLSCPMLMAVVLIGSGVASRAQQPPPTTPPAEPSAKEAVAQAKEAVPAKRPADPIERIKEEAEKRSQVMATLGYLTDVIGPRLTASPGAKRANEWTRDKLAAWGLENAKLEPWGEFGKGWTLKRFSIQVVEPQCIPLIAFPRAWSPGTDGPVTGDVVDLDSVKTEADLDKLKGKLKGAFVLLGPVRDVPARFEPLATRINDSELLVLANAPDVNTRRPRRTPPPAPGTAPTPAPTPAPTGGRGGMSPEQRAALQLQRRKTTFAMEEGAAAILDGSAQGDGGTLFVAQASVPSGPLPGPGEPPARRVSAWDKDAPRILPQIAVSKEHYNRLLRMIRQGESLKMTVDLAVQFHEGDDAKVYNTVAEIPGTDLKDEVVMLGGHMDSWHSGTGATDNAAGVAVAMEAVRIIKALDLKPRRTIRVALWTGEEQGLLGSKAYVREHFGQLGNASPAAEALGNARMAKLTTKPEYEKFSAYYNLDNGTGKIRGIYLQGNEAARSVFHPWLNPFREMGAATVTIANTGGTDHQSFDGIGLPGFQFIQDVVEYDSRTHHSNQDVFDRIQADDMKQASAIMAAFVLNTANRDEKIPRKPAPGQAPSPSPSPAPATPAAAGGN
ncbi:M20/M25/M40 family metallo-hydrolase [Tundrisphaera sp. TA3]|uniref:M20/M25/M40 family metallo-hydrolase n=1 Tax=Tundrisphaera sp. TA3 TaxID=3435775 RepID=UPI003EBE4B85